MCVVSGLGKWRANRTPGQISIDFRPPERLTNCDNASALTETLKKKEPVGYVNKNASKRLAAITRLAFEVIPQDPARPEYRQGGTLGDDHKHWFRAQFFQQYRLFFRYHSLSKVIVDAGVNDEDSKRACQSNYDAYRVFRKMLESGHPPDDWDRLQSEAQKETQRMRKAMASATAAPG